MRMTDKQRAEAAERALLHLYRRVYERSLDRFGDIVSGLRQDTEATIAAAGARYSVPVYVDRFGHLVRPATLSEEEARIVFGSNP